MEQTYKPEIIINPLSQIENELKMLGSKFTLEKIVDDKRGETIKLIFDSQEKNEKTNQQYQNEITFFQVGGNLFYEFGNNTEPGECEEIIKKIEDEFKINLYI